MNERQTGYVGQKAVDASTEGDAWSIVSGKDRGALPVFRPEALLREAGRQKGLPLLPVPDVCVLDPVNIVRHLKRTGGGPEGSGHGLTPSRDVAHRS